MFFVLARFCFSPEVNLEKKMLYRLIHHQGGESYRKADFFKLNFIMELYNQLKKNKHIPRSSAHTCDSTSVIWK